ncbi:hypothetical protein CICLE_v10003544mg [Citrus x clementina]|uniref:Uncharacterized protein n=1 Tax=Citrus clementina TaxID=85681 RepID=V4SBQ3_CITCL|nr:hypothetical protein CICLE_v10003544mg [Citrus x clementina]
MKREFISRCNFEIKLFFHELPILLLVIRNQHFNPTQKLSKLRKLIASPPPPPPPPKKKKKKNPQLKMEVLGSEV